MGSPASRLNIPEHLRPWYDLGLEYVLRPEGAVSGVAPEEPGQASAPAPPIQQPSPQAPSPRQSSQASRQQPTIPPPVGGLPFPAPWDRFAKMAPPAPRVIITYAELGHDLTGNADPRRGQLMRSLLAYLKWPKGTAMFWPCTLSDGSALVPQTAMFWRGAEQFRCPNILCFGSDALRAIYPQAQDGQTLIMLESTTIHLLSPASDLILQLPHEQQLAVASLTSLRV